MLPEIILFGDSLTAWSFELNTRGFGLALEEAYDGKATIVNEGYPGYTVDSLTPEFKRIMDRVTAASAPPVLLFTIFIGANDACMVSKTEAYVPIDRFEAKLREFVETMLDLEQEHENMEATKIVFITPPPINISDPLPDELHQGPGFSSYQEDEKYSRSYMTYMNKKLYADKVMEIAKSYESTGRVAGLNYWKAMIDAALRDQSRIGDEYAYDENRLPGSGLSRAKEFKAGYFTDGLHLNIAGYEILSKELTELVVGKWPELAPDQIEA
jgi:lysophospholipase L1-like esterase